MHGDRKPDDAAPRRIALVTGANRSLGLETCRQLGRRGFDVLLTSRDPDGGRAAADELAREGLAATALPLDVDDPGSVDALAARLRSSGVAPDVLVNNAGILLNGGTVDVARRTLATNFFGALRVTDALAPLMPPGGHVVMVSSTQGELAWLGPPMRARFTDAARDRAAVVALMDAFVADVAAGRLNDPRLGWPTASSAYRVSKAGLNALTRALALELSPRRVRVTAVCPGWVRTMGGPDAERSVEEGAASIVWAAASVDGPTGGFFRDGEPLPW